MKGLAISFIALHNFLHLDTFGFVKENENTFSLNRTYQFFDNLKNFEWSVVGDLFSFVGWIGVPVFLFISGYGLIRKYEIQGGEELESGIYVCSSFRKLFLLMLPAVLVFMAINLIRGDWGGVGRNILSLTLMNNFVIPWFPIEPGAYWYFGLTFELYLLYLLIRKWNVNGLLILGGGFIVFQFVMGYYGAWESNAWSVTRHNFTGWGHLFLLGMIAGKTNLMRFLPCRTLPQALLCLGVFVLIPILNLNYAVWLITVPFAGLLFFILLAAIFEKNKLLRKIGLWLGKYSAFIFVCHPIVRRFIINPVFSAVPIIVRVVVYIVAFLICAVLYEKLYGYMMKSEFLE